MTPSRETSYLRPRCRGQVSLRSPAPVLATSLSVASNGGWGVRNTIRKRRISRRSSDAMVSVRARSRRRSNQLIRPQSIGHSRGHSQGHSRGRSHGPNRGLCRGPGLGPNHGHSRPTTGFCRYCISAKNRAVNWRRKWACRFVPVH